MPNMTGSWVIPVHSYTNSCSLPFIGWTDYCGLWSMLCIGFQWRTDGLGSNPTLSALEWDGLESMVFTWEAHTELRSMVLEDWHFPGFAPAGGLGRLFLALWSISNQSMLLDGWGGPGRLFFCVIWPLWFGYTSLSGCGGLQSLLSWDSGPGHYSFIPF